MGHCSWPIRVAWHQRWRVCRLERAPPPEDPSCLSTAAWLRPMRRAVPTPRAQGTVVLGARWGGTVDSWQMFSFARRDSGLRRVHGPGSCCRACRCGGTCCRGTAAVAGGCWLCSCTTTCPTPRRCRPCPCATLSLPWHRGRRFSIERLPASETARNLLAPFGCCRRRKGAPSFRNHPNPTRWSDVAWCAERLGHRASAIPA